MAFLILQLGGVDMLTDRFLEGWGWLEQAPPVVFFATMAIALLFPTPASVFYVTAGSLYGIVPALLWIPPTLLLNNLIVHWASTSFLRPTVERLVERRGRALPSLETKADQRLFITLIRMTPGVPYFLQNLVLALAGVDRLPFLLISVSVQMIYATGFVVLGRSAFEGELGLAVFALALIAAAAVGARLVHKRLQPAPAASFETSGANVPGDGD